MVRRYVPLISGARGPDLGLGLELLQYKGKSVGRTEERKDVDKVDGGRVAVAAATQGDYTRRIEGRQGTS